MTKIIIKFFDSPAFDLRGDTSLPELRQLAAFFYFPDKSYPLSDEKTREAYLKA